MKKLTTLFFATVTAFAGVTLLYSQGINPQGGYGSTNPSLNQGSSSYGMDSSQYRGQMNNQYPGQMNTPNYANPNYGNQNYGNQNYGTNQGFSNPGNYSQPSNVNNDLKTTARNSNLMALSDDQIAQKIRWAIRDDKKLSSLAKKC